MDSGTPATGDPRSTDLSAGGYNLFTGLGSPVANLLVPGLAGVSPTIGSVVVVPSRGLMTWNAQDSSGVASCSLAVDGAAVSSIHGPYMAAAGVNFSAAFGTLSAGTHSYTITAIDTLGNSSQYSGTFDVAQPLSGVIVPSRVSLASLADTLPQIVVATRGRQERCSGRGGEHIFVTAAINGLLTDASTMTYVFVSEGGRDRPATSQTVLPRGVP